MGCRPARLLEPWVESTGEIAPERLPLAMEITLREVEVCVKLAEQAIERAGVLESGLRSSL